MSSKLKSSSSSRSRVIPIDNPSLISKRSSRPSGNPSIVDPRFNYSSRVPEARDHHAIPSKRSRIDDQDALAYSHKYKEAKLKVKAAQDSYQIIQEQLDNAHRLISRLKTRNQLLLLELKTDRPPRPVSSTSTKSSSNKAPVIDKDGYVVPSNPKSKSGHLETSKSGGSSQVADPNLPRRSRRDLTVARRVQPVPKDDDGNYILPVNIGILTVVNLGTIEYKNPKFHNDRYIWPVGYTVKRYYNSTIHSDKQACYTASIANDNGNPCFQIIADDNPEPIYGITATGAWTSVVRMANKIRRRDHSNSASGPDYFGFSHPTIAKMIQDLPNAQLCQKYNWQDFEMMNPKHVPTRKWHVPPADDIVPKAPSKSPSSQDISNENSSSLPDRSSRPSHPMDVDRLLSESDSRSSSSGHDGTVPRSGYTGPSGNFSDREGSSPISEDFAAVI